MTTGILMVLFVWILATVLRAIYTIVTPCALDGGYVLEREDGTELCIPPRDDR
jgi:hypothetical protein